MRFIPILMSGLLLTACGNGRYESATPIVRIDTLSSAGAVDFKAAAGALRLVYGESSMSDAGIIEGYRQSDATRFFQPDVDSLLSDIGAEETLLGRGLANTRLMLPSASVPSRVYGYVTPYMQSVVIADSVMLIGLNHYLGADYPGYERFEDYKRMMKIASRMPYDAVEAVIYTSFPYSRSSEPTALSRMLYEGAVVYAAQRIFPDAELGDLLGFTSAQMAWANDNEANLWRTLAEKQLLYSVDPLVTSKLVSPSPATTIIHPDAPGRIGRYIGYRIVLAYMKRHESTSLEQLLSPDFYNSQTALLNAGYTP